MKILIADKLSAKTVSALESLGNEVIVKPDLPAEELPGALDGVEALVVRSKKVKATAMQAAHALSLIIRAGVGVDTIDLDFASSRGIYVSNCPGKNTDAVAELAIGLLIAADRRIPDAARDMREGRWRKKEYGKAAGLKGRTLGVLGLGAIGKAVARRAKGLEMHVIAWSRSLTPSAAEESGVEHCPTPQRLFEQADAVSVHLAATPQTRHFVNADLLNRLKKGAIFVNTSRGDVVDTAALKAAILQRQLRAGLDVFEDEPAGGEGPFADKELAELAVCTPHVGASTDQASEATADEVVRIVRTYMDTGKPVNAANVRAATPARHYLIVRHYNRVGVLAGVFDELRNEGINIEEMENTIFESGTAACCTLKLDRLPLPDTVDRISRGTEIIELLSK